jgi:hypothetical protein
MTMSATDAPSFATCSLPAHLLRGAIGFGLIVGAVVATPVIGWPSWLMLPAGLVALRGCPMCWTVGLIQTLSRGRLTRTCVDGECKLEQAHGRRGPEHGGTEHGAESFACSKASLTGED